MTRNPRTGIAQVQYAAPSGHRLGVEVYPAAELRRRVAARADRGAERVDLLCLLYVAAGRYTHMIDFETYRCSAGSVLTVQPGQVHRFGPPTPWDGWFLVLRPERTAPVPVGVAPALDEPADLPAHLRVGRQDRPVVDAALAQMATDARSNRPPRLVEALMHHEVRTLMVRLHLASVVSEVEATLEPVALARFRQFRSDVERHHTEWHAVAPYARLLSCSERSLARATDTVAGTTPKAFITDRVVLEAKRLLVHSDRSVAAIGGALGFHDPTNFVKYFRRETGTTPGAFRSNHRTQEPNVNGA